MRKIFVLSFITLDGVMQAHGRPEESSVTPTGVIIANYRRAGEVKTGIAGS